MSRLAIATWRRILSASSSCMSLKSNCSSASLAIGAASLSLAVVGANTDSYTGPGGRNLGRTGLVLTATTTF